MKLKKIASLMLAGIMAVSMLAGCKTADNGNGGASSSEPTTTTGYSALLEDNLGKAVTDKSYVTFADNAASVRILEKNGFTVREVLEEEGRRSFYLEWQKEV